MSAARVLLIETYRRRSLIRLIHILFFVVYVAVAALYYFPNEMPVGVVIFTVIGIVLPLALSIGIFGNDIASGRFRMLATEPISLASFYVWRTAGVIAQCTLHLALASSVAWAVYALTGQGNVRDLGYLTYATFLMIATIVPLCVTLSVVVRGEANSLAALLIPPFFWSVAVLRESWASGPWIREACNWVLWLGKYGVPPAWMLLWEDHSMPDLRESLGIGLHAAGLAIAYGVIGVTLLARRQYKPQRA